jgi:hypothetical protein
MRDRLKDEKYFEEYLAQEYEGIIEYQACLDNDEIPDERRRSIEIQMNSIRFCIFNAKYSAGYDLDEIKPEFINSLLDMPKFWYLDSESGYFDMITMLSIAYMYEVDDEQWDLLVNLVKNSDIGDWLIYYLISQRTPGIEYDKYQLHNKKHYKYLMELVQKYPGKRLDMKYYLEEKWYKCQKDVEMYEIHLEEEMFYNGYWCFESGAIAKILNYDDADLKDSIYYPYDLVHYGDKISCR